MDISVFPLVFRMGTQKWTSSSHNLGKWIPILKWYTSMNLWWNTTIIYIQIFLIYKGQNFNPFSCSIFPYFQCFRMGTQKWTSNFHNLGKWIPILKWDTSMNLWCNSLIIYIQIFSLFEGQKFNPFSCPIFPYFQRLLEWAPKNGLLTFITWVNGSRF